MTQKEFNKIFKEEFPNWQVMTLTDRRVRYNDLMEHFRKDGKITEKQAQTWGHPKFLKSNLKKINASAY